MARPAIEVENLRATQRALAKAGEKDVVKEIRAANKEAAAMVADSAKQYVPVVTGALQKSIGAQAQRDAGVVKAGTPKGVRYSGPIHFGWTDRNIEPQPFIYEALDKRIEEVRETYDRLLRAALAKRLEPRLP